MRTNLLDHLVKVKNKSGAIPSSPAGLKGLKEAIQGVPFSVDVPGMSQVMRVQNMVPHLVEQVQSLGSLSALGEFKNVLGRVQSQLGVSDITKVSVDELTAAVQSVVTTEEMRQAVGDATALMAALKRFRR